MAICIDHTSALYTNFINKITNNKQKSLESIGLSEFKLDVVISHYMENYGRYPLEEELPKGLSSEKIIDNIKAEIREAGHKVPDITKEWKGSIEDLNNILEKLPVKYQVIKVYTYDNIPILDDEGQPILDEDAPIISSSSSDAVTTINQIRAYESAKSNQDSKYPKKLASRWAVIKVTDQEVEEEEVTAEEEEATEEQAEESIQGLLSKIKGNSKKGPKFIAKWYKNGVLRINKSSKQFSKLASKLQRRYRGSFGIEMKDDSIEMDITGVPNISEVVISDEVKEIERTPIAILNDIMETLENKFGVKTVRVTDLDLASKKWNGILSPRERTARAFIYNGNIYINIDRANIEDPVHELLHLFIAPMFTKEGLSKKIGGYTLFDIISQLEIPNSFLQQFKGSSKNELDIKEEYFVTELAKYLTGQPSTLFNGRNIVANNVIKDILNELWITIQGENNANSFGPDILNISLASMLEAMHSRLKETQPNSDDDIFSRAKLHRQHNNQINELIKQGRIEEECK